jgi:hypothetical protein
MNYDSSKARNIRFADPKNDEGHELLPSEQLAEVVVEKHETSRNWAWAHSHDSYDWMDSHSPFNARESIH